LWGAEEHFPHKPYLFGAISLLSHSCPPLSRLPLVLPSPTEPGDLSFLDIFKKHVVEWYYSKVNIWYWKPEPETRMEGKCDTNCPGLGIPKILAVK